MGDPAFFEHTNPATRILSGPDAADRLPEVLDGLGAGRALLVCSGTVHRGPQRQLVAGALGERVVATFADVAANGGLAGLAGGAARLKDVDADVVVSVGGGATIDSAKCIALLAATDGDLDAHRLGPGRTPRPVPPTVPHVAMPTTAGSSSEIMPWAGIRNEQTREKMLFRDSALTPAVAVLDPRLVVPTPDWLTASSGITALARAVETIYSASRQPIAEALALRSLRLMASALPRAVSNGEDLRARADTQIAATISGIAADNAMVSLVHAVGHVLGGRVALQHGVAHGILLPAAARRFLTVIGPDQHLVAQALGVGTVGLGDDEAGRRAAESLEQLIGGLPIPHRLGEVGIEEADLDDIAAETVRDPMFAHVPSPMSREDVREVLAEAW